MTQEEGQALPTVWAQQEKLTTPSIKGVGGTAAWLCEFSHLHCSLSSWFQKGE